MPLIVAYAADILMICASLGAAVYCLILSRRLSRLTSFDKGIGGAIAVLSAQVDDMKLALSEAKSGSDGAGQQLHDLVRQARDISAELELMIAACHDFAEEALIMQSGDAPPDTPDEDERTDAATEQFGSDQGSTDADEDQVNAQPIFGTRRVGMETPVFHHRSALAGGAA